MAQKQTVKKPKTQELAEIAEHVREEFRKQQVADMAAQLAWLFIGRHLRRAKRLCKHGEFLPWVRENFTFSPRQAQTYMAIDTPAKRTEYLADRAAKAKVEEPYYRASSTAQAFEARLEEEATQLADEEEARNEQNARDQEAKYEAASHLKTPRQLSADQAIMREIIDLGYRAMSKKCHPDTGGDTVKMQHLNRIKVEMVEQLHLEMTTAAAVAA